MRRDDATGRVARIKRHLTRAEDVDDALYADLPQPPVAKLSKDTFFPTFPQMRKDAERHGPVFTYALAGKRRLTIFADPSLFPIVFHPGIYGETEGVEDAVRMEMDKIAHAWFNIPKEVCPWTRDGLNAIRRVMSPANSQIMNQKVGGFLRDAFDAFGESGEVPLTKLASMTFGPVNAAMFGDGNVPSEAEKWFHAFDEYLPMIVRGVPMTAYEECVVAYEKITNMFESSIERIKRGNGIVADRNFAPAITERIAVLDGKAAHGADFSNRVLAQFMVSIFWAPQANTLPMTTWMLAHILADRRVYDEVTREVRDRRKGFGTGKHFDASPENLPYTHACLRETLRLYIANMTHRTVTRNIRVSVDKKTYRIPKDDMLSLASYIQHYDPKIYPSPETFQPERWLERNKKGAWVSLSTPSGGCPLASKRHSWYPFSKGRFSCSGQHLAKLEIPTLVALFLQRYDATLDRFPEADWDDVVASVRPEGWPYECESTVRFSRLEK